MRSASVPFLMMSRVGIPIMLYFVAVSGFSSTLSLPKIILPACSLASSSMMGATIWQGPHHGAQQSMTISGCFLVVSLKLVSVMVIGVAIFSPFDAFIIFCIFLALIFSSSGSSFFPNKRPCSIMIHLFIITVSPAF